MPSVDSNLVFRGIYTGIRYWVNFRSNSKIGELQLNYCSEGFLMNVLYKVLKDESRFIFWTKNC
jgi:hypothetical protein